MSSIVRTGFLLSALAFVVPALRAADDPAAWSVHVVMKSGVRYDGVVVRTAKVAPIFDAKGGPDVTAVAAEVPIEIKWFNGLSGSTSVRAGKIKSIEVNAPLDAGELKARDQKVAAGKEEKWKAETARLQIVEEDRVVRARAAADAAAKSAIEAMTLPPIPDDLKVWLDKFPPEQGWVPAKKDELYHTTVILNSRPLTDQEREWIDNYDDWKPAFEAWFAREQKRIELDEKAKETGPGSAPASGPAPPPPEPTGTAKNPITDVDPDHPTPKELALLPKRLDPNVKPPIGIDPKTKLPIDLNPDAKKPSLLENGERP